MFDRTTSTSARLAAEWARLNHCPVSLARAARWGLVDGFPRDLDEIVTAVGGGGDRSRDADLRFRRLVAMAGDDLLAARVAIERLRPGLLAIAARRRRNRTAFEDIVASAWIAVRTYDPTRRNANLAASLLADANWQAFRRHDRRKSTLDLPLLDTDHLEAAEEDDPGVELAHLLDDARAAGVDPADLDLVDLLLRNPSVEQVAAQLEVTSRTVRDRRARVAAKLRDVALAA